MPVYVDSVYVLIVRGIKGRERRERILLRKLYLYKYINNVGKAACK